jgi:hypothetical protein
MFSQSTMQPANQPANQPASQPAIQSTNSQNATLALLQHTWHMEDISCPTRLPLTPLVPSHQIQEYFKPLTDTDELSFGKDVYEGTIYQK